MSHKQDLLLPLSNEGYVPCWLVSGMQLAPYTPSKEEGRWDDQIAYEVHLREQFYRKPNSAPEAAVIGQPSALGLPWRYVPMRSRFVNENRFFNSLTDVKLLAATCLVSECDQQVEAALWTYMAVDVYVNGQHVCCNKVPRYKPIRRTACTLPLKKGRNEVFLYLQNLGVRDTRNMVALQLPVAQGVQASLPDEAQAADYVAADQWLHGLTVAQGHLQVPDAPPAPARLTVAGQDTPLGAGSHALHDAESIQVHVDLPGQTLTRTIDIQENILPRTKPLPADGDHVMAYMQMLAGKQTQLRSGAIHFAVFFVLARLYVGQRPAVDRDLLLDDLAHIRKRVDCSDFLVTGLIRLVREYPVDDDFAAQMKDTLLTYRYWMDENGADGMCFWSENHALMFHSAQMLAGQMYPDEVFVRSGRTGREQYEKGLARVRAWLDDTEQYGMEEFNSAGYLPVTAAALLNVVDYGPPDVSRRAARLLDDMFRQLCRHVFDGSSISPQGRVYRDVIRPHRQTVQDLLHYILPDVSYVNGDNMWLSCFATSSYRFPEDLCALAQSDYDGTYKSGHARIRLSKTQAYALTSVDCPRDKNDAPQWTNLCFVPGSDRDTNTWTRSINERFHGTSVFEPGVYGYQQHLWYAALSAACVVFVTLPGNDCDNGGMRPDYWYGNGVFPALRQHGNALGLIYEIPEDYPIHFTHAHWPQAAFDRSEHRGQWLFGRARQGAVALWCSGALTPHNDQLINSEYRCPDSKVAWYCACAPCADDAAFEAFMEKHMANAPRYDTQAHTLHMPSGHDLVYEAHENITQFI